MSVVAGLLREWKEAQAAKNELVTDAEPDYISDEEEEVENSNQNDSFINDSGADMYESERRNERVKRREAEQQNKIAL